MGTCYEGYARHAEEGCHAGNEGYGSNEGHARHEEEGCDAVNESHEGSRTSCTRHEGHARHAEEGCHAVNESHEGSCTGHEGHARYEEMSLSKSDSTKNRSKMKDANSQVCPPLVQFHDEAETKELTVS